MNFILIAVLVLGAIALIAALVLFGVSKKFAVEEDPRLGQVGELLPGANCGACGFSGCDGYAKALADGTAQNGLCSPGGADAAEEIKDISKIDKMLRNIVLRGNILAENDDGTNPVKENIQCCIDSIEKSSSKEWQRDYRKQIGRAHV